MADPQHMVEVRGELIPHPGPPADHTGPWENQPHDWMVKLTLARWWNDPKGEKPSCWREVDHTVINHHARQGAHHDAMLDTMRVLFAAIGEAAAVRLIVQKAGDVFTVDWKPHPDAPDVPVTDAKAMAVAHELMLEGRAMLAAIGLIAS